MKRLPGILTTLFASRAFFVGTLVFFVLQALWFVFSAVYPMAFDEEVHVGIIRVYSEQWSPFLSSQALGSDAFGAVIADPSYLYHYLMSFPYRLLTVMTSNEAAQIIVLRLMNVAFFAYSIVVFKKVLHQTGRSPIFTNVAVAVFVLIPITPMLAAHINYDNLLLVAVAWLALLGTRLVAAIRERKVRLDLWAWFVAVAWLGISIKYVLLPMVVAAGLFLVIYTIRSMRGTLVVSAQRSWKRFSGRMVLGLAGLLLLVVFFGSQRYIANQIRYGTVLPSCELVLGEGRCVSFGPWNRNYQLAQTKGDFNHSPLHYTIRWTTDMHYRMFFAVAGPTNTYATRPPLPIPMATIVVISAISVLALVIFLRYARRYPQLAFLFCMSLGYVAALWFENYTQYLETGKAVAVNGRYLLPVLLPLVAVASVGFGKFPASRPVKTAVAALCLALLFYGGGALTYMYYAEPSWYWNNGFVQWWGDVLRAIVQKIIVIDGYF